MSLNNRPATRRSTGRYNTPGQFVSAGEVTQPNNIVNQGTPQKPSMPVSQPEPAMLPPPPPQMSSADIEMKEENMTESEPSISGDSYTPRPFWMKNRLAGVRKISNKERRRRQNENLRRLLTPKNALMVLNEMLPHEQITNQFKVEPASNQFYKPNIHSFCADITIEGTNYKGYGENKLTARNAAAEQAIRDLIIKKMTKAVKAAEDDASVSGDGASSVAGDGASSVVGEGAGGAEVDEEAPLPMIQLASFALHKLFAEWEYEGHKVPQLRPPTLSLDNQTETLDLEPRGRPPPPPKELPANAAAMHPAMLLTYMRSNLEYRELAVQGDRPQNMLFTMGVEVDGQTYVGKATNKKEARKGAARAACHALFNVRFNDDVAK